MRRSCALVLLAGILCLGFGCRTRRVDATSILIPTYAGTVSAEDLSTQIADEKRRLSVSPLRFCPRGAALAAMISEVGRRVAENGSDPALPHARWMISPAIPPTAWNRAKKRLDLDGKSLFAMYFGTEVAVISVGHPRRDGIVLVSRARPEALACAPDAFGLVRTPARDRLTFRFYELIDGPVTYAVAMSKDCFLLGEMRCVGTMRLLIETGATCADTGLVSDPVALTLIAKLPRNRVGIILGRDRKGYARHAAALVHDGHDIVLNYVSTDPVPDAAKHPETIDRDVLEYVQARERSADGSQDPQFPHLSQTDKLELGPLPKNTVGVAALNVIHHCPRDLGVLDMPVVFGSVRQRILPGVRPPFLGFIASTDVPDSSGSGTVSAPVTGIAVRLASPDIAGDIDHLLQTFHFLATLSSFELGKSLFGIDTFEDNESSFRVADFGSTLIRWLKDPGLAALANLPEPAGLRRITFGRIGEWYIVCTQEQFFRDCIQAYRDPAERYTARAAYDTFGMKSRQGLLFSAMTEAEALGTLVTGVQEQLLAQKSAYQEEEGADSGKNTSMAPAACVPFRPTERVEQALVSVDDVFAEIAKGWRKLHTIPSESPEAKKDNQIVHVGNSREPVKTDPDRALQPLNWLADALKQRSSFSGQVWRAPDGTPRGILRIVPSTIESSQNSAILK